MPTPDELLLNKGLKHAVDSAVTAVQQTAASSTNDMSSSAVVGATRELQKNIAVEISKDPILQHKLNAEPHWWQQRTKWAFIVSMLLVFLRPALHSAGYDISEGMQEWVVTSLTTIGDLAAGLLALRAGQASKPMFTKWVKNPVSYRG